MSCWSACMLRDIRLRHNGKSRFQLPPMKKNHACPRTARDVAIWTAVYGVEESTKTILLIQLLVNSIAASHIRQLVLNCTDLLIFKHNIIIHKQWTSQLQTGILSYEITYCMGFMDKHNFTQYVLY